MSKHIYSFYCRIVDFHHTELYIEGNKYYMTIRIVTIKKFCIKTGYFKKLDNVIIERLMMDLYEVSGYESNVKAFLRDAAKYILRVEVIK